MIQSAVETIQSYVYFSHPRDFQNFRLDLSLPGRRRLEINRRPGMRAPLSRVERGRHSFAYWGNWEAALYRAA